MSKNKFPFRGRVEELEDLWKAVVLPNWQNFNSDSTTHKEQPWSAAYIHGGAGVGKTRLSEELLSALYNHLSLLHPTIKDEEQVSFSFACAFLFCKDILIYIALKSYRFLTV